MDRRTEAAVAEPSMVGPSLRRMTASHDMAPKSPKARNSLLVIPVQPGARGTQLRLGTASSVVLGELAHSI